MKLIKRCLLALLIVTLLISCTACSGLDKLADNFKGGVQQFSDNVAIGKSNALITPYQSFEGSRTSDNAAFEATYRATVAGFKGQDILVGKTDLKSKECREITIRYEFKPTSGVCRLIYIDPELNEATLAESGSGSVTVQLKQGANYIGIYGDSYNGGISITVE